MLEPLVLSVSISSTETLLHLWSLTEEALVDTDILSYRLFYLDESPTELNLFTWNTELRYYKTKLGSSSASNVHLKSETTSCSD